MDHARIFIGVALGRNQTILVEVFEPSLTVVLPKRIVHGDCVSSPTVREGSKSLPNSRGLRLHQDTTICYGCPMRQPNGPFLQLPGIRFDCGLAALYTVVPINGMLLPLHTISTCGKATIFKGAI